MSDARNLYRAARVTMFHVICRVAYGRYLLAAAAIFRFNPRPSGLYRRCLCVRFPGNAPCDPVRSGKSVRPYNP